MDTLRTEVAHHAPPEPVMIEPVRALASNIGVLRTCVGIVKTWEGVKTWLNVDPSQNHPPNILSAAWYYRAVAAANADPPPESLRTLDIVGPLCTFDVMGADRRLRLAIGHQHGGRARLDAERCSFRVVGTPA